MVEPITALIVDDERLARKRLRNLLRLEPDMSVLGECANADEALTLIASRPPELMFLDVQMPGRDGFTLVEALPMESLPLIVFVTAYNDYAIRAFEINAVDYLLKPFDRSRFQKTLMRVRAQRGAGGTNEWRQKLESLLEGMHSRRRDRIAIRNGSHVVFVRVEDIDWIEAADNYICLHCGAVTHVMRETLNSVESRLDPSTFLRIHRSFIVNLDRVQELRPWFGGDYRVVLRDGTQLALSRSYRDKIQSRLLE